MSYFIWKQVCNFFKGLWTCSHTFLIWSNTSSPSTRSHLGKWLRASILTYTFFEKSSSLLDQFVNKKSDWFFIKVAAPVTFLSKQIHKKSHGRILKCGVLICTTILNAFELHKWCKLINHYIPNMYYHWTAMLPFDLHHPVCGACECVCVYSGRKDGQTTKKKK